MHASLRAFMAGIIDYAGMFPPAQLPLEPAVRNYVRYRHEREAWMLGRFICPAGKLGELAGLLPAVAPDGPPLRLSVLARGGETGAALRESFAQDVQDMGALSREHAARALIEACEVRMPADVLHFERRADLNHLLNALRASLNNGGFTEVALACEAPPGGERIGRNVFLASGIWDLNLVRARSFRGSPPVVLKLRCGGTEPAAFPTATEVACVLASCARDRLPLKFTAGLHHPIAHHDAALGVFMHGFVNVVTAALLAYGGCLPARLPEILSDTDAAQFRFDAAGMEWRDLSISTAEIGALRQQFGLSFGSCSFDEPRDDLRALGLLDARP